ncbi:hypothetical protein OZJ73_25525, partial [Escherichia coli]
WFLRRRIAACGVASTAAAARFRISSMLRTLLGAAAFSLAHRRTVRGGIPMVRATVALVAPSCSSSLSAWAFCSVVYFFMVPALVGFSPVLKRHALKMAGV